MKNLIIFLFIQFSLSSMLINHSSAQEAPETATSVPEYIPRPKPKTNEDTSTTVLTPSSGRPLSRTEISSLQQKTCPNSEFCPGLNSGSDGKSLFSAACSGFIDEKGNFGELGVTMLEALKEVELSILNTSKTSDLSIQSPSTNFECLFSSGEALAQSCPNFKYLNEDQKDHVWVWFWASLAESRSGCNMNSPLQVQFNPNLGRNRLSKGLFGLEYTANERAVNGSDPAFCPHTPVETTNLYYQSRCATSIVLKSAKCKGLGRGQNFGEQIPTNQPMIYQLLQRHPLCKK